MSGITWHDITGLDFRADKDLTNSRTWIREEFAKSPLAAHREAKRMSMFLSSFPFPWRIFVSILTQVTPRKNGYRAEGYKHIPLSDKLREAATLSKFGYDVWADPARPVMVPSVRSTWPAGLEDEERQFLAIIGVEPMSREPEPVASGTEEDEPF